MRIIKRTTIQKRMRLSLCWNWLRLAFSIRQAWGNWLRGLSLLSGLRGRVLCRGLWGLNDFVSQKWLTHNLFSSKMKCIVLESNDGFSILNSTWSYEFHTLLISQLINFKKLIFVNEMAAAARELEEETQYKGELKPAPPTSISPAGIS